MAAPNGATDATGGNFFKSNISMAKKNEQKWEMKYEQLKNYIQEHHHLPDKKKVDNRGLLNWWKYNKKMIKLGQLDAERVARLQELSDMRSL